MFFITHLTRSFTPSKQNLPPITAPIKSRAVEVDTSFNCPNINCKIYEPHTYHDFRMLTPPPPDVLVILLQRFNTSTSPFPNMNCWEVVGTTLSTLQRERMVYNVHYGLVKLKRKAVEQEKDGWKVFQCLDKEDEVVAEIVVRCNPSREPLVNSPTRAMTEGNTNLRRFLPFLCPF
jgi:hypothetical protein